jgi:predicted RND superfamily exporter protein
MLGVLVVLLLIVTFRRLADIVWVGISLALSSILTLAVMTLAGWSWNFVNAAAVLICLGCGSDYSIHMLLALRRSASVPEALADTGQAIVVCTLTSVVGFGSLAWASNLGLASLGQVCALALGLNCLIATYLLPFLWHFVHRAAPSPK